MAAYGLSSLSFQIQGLQSKNILQKCREVEDILKRTSTKELRPIFPAIVNSIFGVEGEPGWGIDRLCRSQHQTEFEAVLGLLAPGGPLLNAVNALQQQAESCFSFTFPFQNLPCPSRHAIEEGLVPLFYINRLQSQGFPVPVLALNAFELYMFHFAYPLVSPGWQQGGSSWSSRMYDWLYPALVDHYLNYFMPLDRSDLPTLPTTSPVRSRFPHMPFSIRHATSSMVASPRRQQQQRVSLFNPQILMQHKQHAHAAALLDSSEGEMWLSETMLQIFVEFWLNQNSLVTDSSPVMYGSWSSVYCGQSRSAFSYIFEHFMPSLNQVLIVRMLVKYLHYFTNTVSSILTSPYQHRVDSPLDHFKRVVVPQTIQKKIYCFLRHAFDHWPLDCYFRMVLETWLSYIQPWRYTDVRHYCQGKEQRVRHQEPRERHVEDKWMQFVEDNLLFYTVLFHALLPRLQRMDLASPSSSYMLFRVTKVFSSPHLADYIASAEQEVCAAPVPLSRTAELGGSYLSLSRLQPAVPNLPPHLSDMEMPGFQYVPLFSTAVQEGMNNLLRKAIDAFIVVSTPQSDTATSSGHFSWFWSLFSLKSSSKSDTHRTAMHLKEAAKNLSKIFKLPVPEQLDELQQSQNLQDSTMLEEDSAMPDCIQTPEGPRLTERGRHQIINNQRRFQTWQTGDPDLQPICSFENATLVRLLFQICSLLNSYFGNHIWQLYQRRDFVGCLAKVYLTPPLSPTQPILSPVNPETASHLRTPRLSLRLLASYRTLSLLLALYLALYLWVGMGPVMYLFLLAAGIVLYGVVCALFLSTEVR